MYAKKNLEVLKKLCNAKCRKKLLDCCNKNHIYALCECAENVLIGNVPLTEQQKQKLKRHRASLLKLANPNITWKIKKKFCKQQQGKGFITALLGIAVAALISLFTSAKQ